ncbi:MAG: phycobilisome linker polypeptide [Cyanobacteria bacterium P01_F01_bin.33]
MMVVTVTGAARAGLRTIAIAYSRLAQTLQSIRRMGGKIVSVTEASPQKLHQTSSPPTAKVTPIQPEEQSQVATLPTEKPAEEAPKASVARQSRSRTAAKTQSTTTTAKPKRTRTTRSRRKRATS